MLLVILTLVWLVRYRDRYKNPNNDSQETLQRFDYFLLAFIGLILLLGLQLALAPPIAWDGLSTHLVLVRDIISEGRLLPSPYSVRPIVGHLLFAWGMALGGDSLPQLISFAQAMLMVAAVAMFSRQHFGRRAGLLAAAFLCSVEVFIITATWPYADLPAGFFGSLSVLALVNWQLARSSGRAWLITAAIFAVLAAHSKLNGLFVYPVLLAGIILGLWWQRENLKNRLVDVASALVVGIVLAVIWTFTENALKPETTTAIAQISQSALITAESIAGSRGLFSDLSSYLRVIWEMTIIGQQGGQLYDGSISPFFLIFTPLILFLPGKPRTIWALLLAVLIEFGAWLLVPAGYYQNRHLILVYPFFSILAAYFVYRLPELDHPKFNVSGFVKILIIIVFVFQFLFLLSWYQNLNPAKYLLGLESRDQYLASKLNGGTSPGYYDMMSVMNDSLSPESVVGVAWPEPRVFFCDMNCIQYALPRSGSVEQMAESARANGLTHLLISEKGLNYWLEFREDDASYLQQLENYGNALDEFVGQYGILEHVQDDSYYLYRLQLDP